MERWATSFYPGPIARQHGIKAGAPTLDHGREEEECLDERERE